jgi:2',3'-cyclic-nucleotide 2'-phosphodiesterase (5'-nucleotidase family)
MVNLKKYNVVSRYFVLFLTFILSVSCGEQKYYVTKIEGKDIGITNSNKDVEAIETFVKPYRDHINTELNNVISYAPETLDKSGQWQTTIGNLLADITLQRGNAIFTARENKKIDLCLLNNGGIRSIIPKGNVTLKTAFEIMPFENTSIVVALKGAQIAEMVTYLIAEKKPHPISGIQFTIDKNNQAKDILIQGKALENETLYYVITSDYLSNGGDKMDFFKKGTATFDLNYKLRNILIDYLKETDTIPILKDKRILIE